MQVSLPSSSNFLMSPLVIFLIRAFCFADLWCVCMLCITWKPHSQGIYCSFLLWHQQLSADCTQGGTGRDNQPFWMPAFIHSHPSVQISFGNDSHEGTQEKWFQVLGMEHMIKPKCFGNTALGLCAHLGALRRTDPALPWWELVRNNK